MCKWSMFTYGYRTWLADTYSKLCRIWIILVLKRNTVNSYITYLNKFNIKYQSKNRNGGIIRSCFCVKNKCVVKQFLLKRNILAIFTVILAKARISRMTGRNVLSCPTWWGIFWRIMYFFKGILGSCLSASPRMTEEKCLPKNDRKRKITNKKTATSYLKAQESLFS